MSTRPSHALRLAALGVATASLAGGVLLSNAPESAAAPPSSYTVKGIDTSHHNHDATGQPIDWKRVAQKNAFTFLKATQGSRYQDPWFARDFKAASATSLLRAPYHFFDPKSTGDGAAQADHFIRTARAAGYSGTKPGELPPVLDVESVWVNGKEVCPKALRAGQLDVFLKRVKAAFKVTPIVYTRASFVNGCMAGKGQVFKDYPLWLARYGSGAREPQSVPGAGSWTFWQYTESERVPGVPGAKNTVGKADRNVYRGTLAQLRALANLGGTPAPPRPGVSWPTVKQGQRGVDVTTVQLLLTARGHAVKADGIFGSGTATRVKTFQKTQHLTADGIVGPQTWTRLAPTLKPGAKGTAVTALQHQLTANGHTVKTDGAYGPATTTKVKAFQKAHRLTADGITGTRTWAALVRGGGSGGGGGKPGGGEKLSDAQAAAKLKAAGISRVSSGNCTDRNRKNCTSLQGIRVGTVNGVVSLKKKSGCKVTVTGGTETGHAGGTYSHWNGYKVDISRTSCVTNYIQGHAKKHHKRRDGAWVWRVTSGGKTVIDYADERWANHWDITYY